jgi:hypothetical protein
MGIILPLHWRTRQVHGWAGRTWNSQCPYNKAAFLMQISTLVIAPFFFAAAIYLSLARLIVRRGPQYSLLNPKAYP